MSAIEEVMVRGGFLLRSRARCMFSSVALALAVAGGTIAHLFLATHGPRTALDVAAMVPLIALASLAGVTPTAYVALDMVRRRQWLPAASSMSISMLVAFVIFWSCALTASPRPNDVTVRPVVVATRQTFDRATWLGDATVRPRMAQDLAGRDLLVGMTREQVLFQLGRPTSTTGRRHCDMCYELETGGNGQSLDLHVVLSAADRVRLVNIDTADTSEPATRSVPATQ